MVTEEASGTRAPALDVKTEPATEPADDFIPDYEEEHTDLSRHGEFSGAKEEKDGGIGSAEEKQQQPDEAGDVEVKEEPKGIASGDTPKFPPSPPKGVGSADTPTAVKVILAGRI